MSAPITDLKCMLLYLASISCCMAGVVGQSLLVRVISGCSGVFLGKISVPFFTSLLLILHTVVDQ